MVCVTLLLVPVMILSQSLLVHSLTAIQECPNGHIVNDSYWECHYGPQSIFEWLIYPISTMEFESAYFEKQPLYISRSSLNKDYYNMDSMPFANCYDNMLDIIDHRSIHDLLHPEIQIIKYDNITNKSVEIKHFRMDLRNDYKSKLTKRERKEITEYHKALKHDLNTNFDVAAIIQLTQGNVNKEEEAISYTVRFGSIEKHLKVIQSMLDALSLDLGVGITTNIYYTPSKGKGFDAHFGTEDIFILQLNGTNHHRVYYHMYKYCMSAGDTYPWNVNYTVDSKREIQRKSTRYCHSNTISDLQYNGYNIFTDDKLSKYNPKIDTILNVGDMLYIPRGFVYESDVFNGNEASIHLGIEIYHELYADFLFTLIRYMFSMDSFSILWKNIFLVFKKETELGKGAQSVTFDKTDIRKGTLKELEYFLMFESYIDDNLRKAMPNGFYHYDIFNDFVYDTIAIPLIEITFGEFMQYVKVHKNVNYALKKDGMSLFYRSGDVQEIIDILQQKKIKTKFGKKIYKHYSNAITDFNGVYMPTNNKKNHAKQFKRISYSLRSLEKRGKLAAVLNTRPSN